MGGCILRIGIMSTETQNDQDYTEIHLSDSAQQYLSELLATQEQDVVGIRVYISEPGSPRAETCIAYCRENDVAEDAIVREYKGFTAYFDAHSWPYLESANIDYAADRMGGQLTIKAPNSKMPQVNDDSPLPDRINYILYTEVNPSLASHGGEVTLMTVDEENYAILQFGGGCQGCAAVDATLKGGVEKTLMEHLPELAGVRDVTDHSDKTNAYY